jgi:hypothetical protein
MDAQYKKTVIINQQLGIEYQGLWLSNTKWFDAASFGIPITDKVRDITPLINKSEFKLSEAFRYTNFYAPVKNSFDRNAFIN